MSFETVCKNCGATSEPSVGICPFCKSVLTAHDEALPGEVSVEAAYNDGNLELALTLAKKLYSSSEPAKSDRRFTLTYLKILLDTEAPESTINSVLSEGLIRFPADAAINEYQELMEARTKLSVGLNDEGEQRLKAIIRKNPDNYHAYFFLGAHLYWIDKAAGASVFYLEQCSRLAPKFLRVWGCLSAVYRSLNNTALTENALRKCIELERNATMKSYFESELKKMKD